jgi:hypothetical protein
MLLQYKDILNSPVRVTSANGFNLVAREHSLWNNNSRFNEAMFFCKHLST